MDGDLVSLVVRPSDRFVTSSIDAEPQATYRERLDALFAPIYEVLRRELGAVSYQPLPLGRYIGATAPRETIERVCGIVMRHDEHGGWVRAEGHGDSYSIPVPASLETLVSFITVDPTRDEPW